MIATGKILQARHRPLATWYRGLVAPSIILSVLIAGVSGVGIFYDDFYQYESINWQLQAGGQDLVDLFVLVPLLAVCAVSLRLNKRVGVMILAGALLYTVYTFMVYCFDVHFNRLFAMYCLVLCLSIYSLLYLFYHYLAQGVRQAAMNIFPFRLIGIFFIVISLAFAALWLSEIVPAILHNQPPANLRIINLPTNPVHVLDLALLLPGIFSCGILLFFKKRIGYLLAPVFLVFFILMDLTIALLTVILKTQGQDGSFVLAAGMIALALISLVLFLAGLKSILYEHK
ncbi:MAG: hypothetical protein HOP08_12360 [Cyclobacteriaceae bacterium]|nr:hypothetical protein [Cyclobacteriaceae bacterium]